MFFIYELYWTICSVHCRVQYMYDYDVAAGHVVHYITEIVSKASVADCSTHTTRSYWLTHRRRRRARRTERTGGGAWALRCGLRCSRTAAACRGARRPTRGIRSELHNTEYNIRSSKLIYCTVHTLRTLWDCTCTVYRYRHFSVLYRWVGDRSTLCILWMFCSVVDTESFTRTLENYTRTE